MTAQLALDLTEPLPEWTGSPLGYHEQFATVEQHVAALERWAEEHQRFGYLKRSRMWHPNTYAGGAPGDDHTCHVLVAECRTLREGEPRDLPAHVPEAYMHQALCEPCRWHIIDPSERVVVEAWHDHAFPGWRDLPIVPHGLSEKKRDAWITEQYGDRPEGHPIRTERPSAMACRHVAGRSPWGGFDLGYHPDKDDA
jgi:hypothetical protein